MHRAPSLISTDGWLFRTQPMQTVKQKPRRFKPTSCLPRVAPSRRQNFFVASNLLIWLGSLSCGAVTIMLSVLTSPLSPPVLRSLLINRLCSDSPWRVIGQSTLFRPKPSSEGLLTECHLGVRAAQVPQKLSPFPRHARVGKEPRISLHAAETRASAGFLASMEPLQGREFSPR